MSQSLVMCAKSTWQPSIRREHAFARQALGNHIETTFIEAPGDIRSFMTLGTREWTARLQGSACKELGGPSVVSRTTLIPGHRHRLAAGADNALLRRILQRQESAGVVVVNVPWQWKATAGISARRVFDAADDWTALIPNRRREMESQYRQISDEADAVIVASPSLADLFSGRPTALVPNAAEASDIPSAASLPPRAHRLVYVGTLSERFDADLVDATLELLPEWQLDLYGQCRYAGAGDAPGASLLNLLSKYPSRVKWHSVVSRSRLPEVIDSADVFLVPNVSEAAAGQSSMKAFDCAARGRPMVTTAWPPGSAATRPPHTWEISNPGEAAESILAAAHEPVDHATRRCAWARDQTWDSRWPAWAAAVGLSSSAATPAGPVLR